MSAPSLSSPWSTIAPAVANHLWQSTLIAVAAGLLTLLLRKHNARARYWLWLAASLKFLVPFSFLVALGDRLSWSHATVPSNPVLFVAVDEFSRPFTQSAVTVASPHSSLASASLPHLSTVLALVWLAGFLSVLVVWTARWLKISFAARKATPLSDGREAMTLRRIEHAFGLQKPIALLQSRVSLEPGVFGIVQPVLVWPEGISTHLHDAHLEAIMAHEVWHVRRRDNLFAALHMLVEAIFWFYPLVWWLGTRLIDERERACDEEVVALGNDRQVYAESILKVCEFCLGSPLPCVSGVTGADLKQRMVHIMNDRILHKLDFARKLLLTAAAFLAVAVPITFGVLHATPSRAQSQAEPSALSKATYSFISIKPSTIANGDNRTQMMFSLKDGSFVANGVTLERLIEVAYHVPAAQISGPHDLLNKTKFDIDARLEPSSVAATRQQVSSASNFDDQVMLKFLLANRFKLVTHVESQTHPSYDLVIDESGAKLQPAGNEPRMMHLGHGELTSSGAPVELLTAQLSARLGRPVLDKTGLKGAYAFNLRWTPDASEDELLKQSGEPVALEPVTVSNGPSLVTALREQLGLKLEPSNEPVPILVVDHAEEPTE